jgi:hypothetical protein
MTVSRCLFVAFATMVMVTAAPSQAQEPSPNRLPKGIEGLEQGQGKSPSANWLRDAKDDEERFRRIEIYAGGTYHQMWEIGHRYQQIHRAIIDENWDLGLHHWVKLRDVFNVALMKRPNRTANAEALFLDTTWQQLADALKSRDAVKVRQAFLTERAACMSCHVAENMPFLNDTPIFRDTASLPED